MWNEILQSILGGVQGGAEVFGKNLMDEKKRKEDELKRQQMIEDEMKKRQESAKYNIATGLVLKSAGAKLSPGKNTPSITFGDELAGLDFNDPDFFQKVLGGMPVFGSGKVVPQSTPTIKKQGSSGFGNPLKSKTTKPASQVIDLSKFIKK